MRKQILVPIDGSEQSTDALEYVIEEYPTATVTLLHVIDPIEAGYGGQASPVPGYSEEWYEESEEAAQDLFAEARELVEKVGFDGEVADKVELGRPARVIVELADEEGFDHIVMGSHGRSGVTRVLLGSVAETVVRRSPVPVTVVR